MKILPNLKRTSGLEENLSQLGVEYQQLDNKATYNITPPEGCEENPEYWKDVATGISDSIKKNKIDNVSLGLYNRDKSNLGTAIQELEEERKTTEGNLTILKNALYRDNSLEHPTYSTSGPQHWTFQK